MIISSQQSVTKNTNKKQKMDVNVNLKILHKNYIDYKRLNSICFKQIKDLFDLNEQICMSICNIKKDAHE